MLMDKKLQWVGVGQQQERLSPTQVWCMEVGVRGSEAMGGCVGLGPFGEVRDLHWMSCVSQGRCDPVSRCG